MRLVILVTDSRVNSLKAGAGGGSLISLLLTSIIVALYPAWYWASNWWHWTCELRNDGSYHWHPVNSIFIAFIFVFVLFAIFSYRLRGVNVIKTTFVGFRSRDISHDSVISWAKLWSVIDQNHRVVKLFRKYQARRAGLSCCEVCNRFVD